MKKFMVVVVLLSTALLIGLASPVDAKVTTLRTADSIRAVMSGAPATSNPVVVSSWSAKGAVDVTQTALNGATAVTVVAAPTSSQGQKFVDSILVTNTDTAAVTVTLSRRTASVDYSLCKVTLAVGDTLFFTDDGGPRVTDSSGQAKSTVVTASTATVRQGVRPTDWRVHDAVGTNLPTTAASDDLGLVAATDGTGFASLQTINFRTTTASALARCWYALPPNYVAGSAVTIYVRGGTLTTVSDGTATVDLNVYSNTGNALGSADLCTTNAQSINSLTFADKAFTITPTGLVAGQLLNIKLTVAGGDTATATAVTAAVAAVEVGTTVSQ